MNVFKKLFKKIANFLGFEIQEKDLKEDEYFFDELNLTKIISNKVSTLALMDSKISVIGDNNNASFLDELLKKYLINKISQASEISLSTGDCILKPYTDGKSFGVDIIKNFDFVVTKSVGDNINGIILKCDSIKKDYDVYLRFESQEIKNVNDVNYLIIKQFAFKNEVEVDLSILPQWQNLQKEIIIKNCNNLLIGRIKSPTIDINNINGVNGVPITFGSEKIMKQVIKSYNSFNREIEDKEAFIFASELLFPTNDNGKRELPKGKQRIFTPVKINGESSDYINIYSPEIRINEFEKGLEMNLKMLEISCGLSAGILTSPHTNFATATEMKASLQSTFAYITKFREFIEKGVIELINSINVINVINNKNIIGDFQVEFDWSTAFVEQLTEQFNRLMQGESIGAVSKEEIRQFIFDEDIEKSREKVGEIQKLRVEKDEY